MSADVAAIVLIDSSPFQWYGVPAMASLGKSFVDMMDFNLIF